MTSRATNSMTSGRPGWRETVESIIRSPRLMLRRFVPARLHFLLDPFWLVPLILGGLGILGPPALQLVDQQELAGIFGGDVPEIDVEGARATLSVVASGVITITSLLFSLAFVALSIAAQQLSPRVLDYVVEERTTQLLIGLSFATFLFAAITLSFGSTGGEVRLVFSALIALFMAVITLAAMILFIHRMTQIMRAEDMVTWLGSSFRAAIRRGPSSISKAMMVSDPAEARALERRMETARPIRATKTGYLGAVDYPNLLAWTEKNDLLIEILLRENAFVLEGQVFARILAPEGADLACLAERVTYHVNLTERRVVGETPEYQGASLSEVALRALSPGINDPATARACANQLYHGLAILASLPERPRALKGSDEIPRILRARHGIAELLEANVAPIVEAARDQATLCHLAELNDTLSTMVRRPAERAATMALARLIAKNGDVSVRPYLAEPADPPPATGAGTIPPRHPE
ncbi:MAG TPA: DUF2254 family protein [Paracoccaceae bacterium]|nr:DUF2254 family protein [Paracoccaceae bacterium]